MTPLGLLAALCAAAAGLFLFPDRSRHRLRMLTSPVAGRGAGRRNGKPAAPGVPLPEALVLDLVAAVLDGGASPVTAAGRVAEALAAAGDPAGPQLERCAAAVAALAPATVTAHRPRSEDPLAQSLAEALLLAAGTGLAPAPLVRRAAAQHRRRAALAATAAARRLAVLLMLPTGLCLLPAFVFLGLVPIAIDLFSGIAPALT